MTMLVTIQHYTVKSMPTVVRFHHGHGLKKNLSNSIDIKFDCWQMLTKKLLHVFIKIKKIADTIYKTLFHGVQKHKGSPMILLFHTLTSLFT